jgi:hypothetical protein
MYTIWKDFAYCKVYEVYKYTEKKTPDSDKYICYLHQKYI